MKHINLIKNLSLLLAVLFFGACATTTNQQASNGDAYTGTETVKFLADGVPDRVFFATNKFDLTPAANQTLSKQITYLKTNSNLKVVIEGHADERGTREYNLALGEKRANSVKDFLISNGISSDRIKVISYGKEKPANPASNAQAWAQNRRSVTVKTTN